MCATVILPPLHRLCLCCMTTVCPAVQSGAMLHTVSAQLDRSCPLSLAIKVEAFVWSTQLKRAYRSGETDACRGALAYPGSARFSRAGIGGSKKHHFVRNHSRCPSPARSCSKAVINLSMCPHAMGGACIIKPVRRGAAPAWRTGRQSFSLRHALR